MLEKYKSIFDKKLIFDWNICDWFCVRVLGPTIIENDAQCAKAIVNWKDAEYIWQARASVVSFVNLASEARYYPYIEKAAITLIRREERFVKTAVGWILHDIYKYDQNFVVNFINNNLDMFSLESLKNALKYFNNDQKEKYIGKFKKA